MSKLNKSISVCIATCNGEKYIVKQLESILNQSTPVHEIIISDDSSTDNTIEIIKNIDDQRIVLLEGNYFHSPALNFQNALRSATGDYIFLADQDDIWHINKVEILLSLLNEYDLVVSDCAIIDENDEIIASSLFEIRNSGPGILKNIIKNSYHGCCMAFRKSLLEKALPFPASISMHDIWLGILAEVYGSAHFCTDKLVYYRRHSSNASFTGAKSRYSFIQRIIFRYKLILAIVIRCTKQNIWLKRLANGM